MIRTTTDTPTTRLIIIRTMTTFTTLIYTTTTITTTITPLPTTPPVLLRVPIANSMGFTSWAGWPWISLFSSLLLSFRVLSAGYAKLTYQTPPSQIADEIRKKYSSEDKENDQSQSYFTPSPARIRDIRGVIEVVCGILLLLPACQRLGAAIAFSLLVIGLVSRIRSGQSIVSPLIMMTHCGLVWFFIFADS